MIYSNIYPSRFLSFVIINTTFLVKYLCCVEISCTLLTVINIHTSVHIIIIMDERYSKWRLY